MTRFHISPDPGIELSFGAKRPAMQLVVENVKMDFRYAETWKVKLPANLALAANPLLRLHYRGDVARVKIGDTFIMDDLFNGEPLEIGLARHADLLKSGDALTVEILPLQRGAPIYLPPTAQLSDDDGPAVVELIAAELVTRPSTAF